MSAVWLLGAAAEPAVSHLAWWRFALLGLLFAALLGIWFFLNRSRFSLGNLRSFGAPGRGKIEVKDQRWLSSRIAVALVEVDGQRFLLAHGPDAVAWQPLPPSSPSAS